MGGAGQGRGAEAHLILVPGHCYPVLQAGDGTMIAIEATGVGGSNLGGVMSFEKAVEAGNKQLQDLMQGKTIGKIVSITDEQARGIRPPEFAQADLAGLSDMLNKRVAGGRNPSPNPNPNPNPNPQPGPNPGPNPGPIDGGNSTQVAGMTISYPGSYQPNMMVVQQIRPYLPSYVFSAVDQTGMRSIDCYDFGPASTQQAIQQIAGFAQNAGAFINFGGGQQMPFRGRPAEFVPMQVSVNGMMLDGGMYFVQSPSGGLAGIAATSPQGDMTWQQTLAAMAAGQ